MTDTSNVATPRVDYTKGVTVWQMVEDACAGSQAVKDATVKYLPKPNPKDVSEENRTRYEQYLLRAVYYNAVGRTLHGLVGIAYRRDPEVQLPASIEFAKLDCDGAGLSLSHKGQQLLINVLKCGRCGVLVDYPKTDGPTSIAAQQSNALRPIIALYDATDVINWRVERINGKSMLSMVVLREAYEEKSDWVGAIKTQYRVLRLAATGYTTEVWRQDAEHGDGWFIFEGPDAVIQGNGQAWTEIPFTFVGSQDNDTDVDPSPLYDLAVLNLAHYRNSADYEDSVYFVGQPMYFMSGLSEAWRDDIEKSGVHIGSRSVLALPHGGTAGILQAEPNNLARTAMQDKESQMAALGARLLMNTGSAKTATQQNSEDAASHSVLTLCCNNVSAAMTKALGWFAIFANTSGETTYEINTEFVIDQLDAPTLVALLQLVQAGKLPESDLWTQLRNVGLIDAEKTDDQIREEVAGQNPSGVPNPFDGAGSAGANIPVPDDSINPEGVSNNVPRSAVGG